MVFKKGSILMEKFNRLTIIYPEDVLLSLKIDKEEFEQETRFILV